MKHLICNKELYERHKNVLFAVSSVVIGIYLTLISYPGIFYTDSYARWETAQYILNGDFSNIASWVSITPQFFMALTYGITYNYSTFTLIQSILFFFSSFLIIDRFLCGKKIFVIMFLIICPIFYGYSVFCESSIGCIIGLNFGMLLLMSKEIETFDTWKLKNKICYFIFLLICFYVFFGFRQNAITVLPVIIMISIYLYRKNKSKLQFIMNTTGVSAGFVLVILIPSILGIKTANTSSAGLVWEMASIIQEMPDNVQQKYIYYFDSFMGEGITQEILYKNKKQTWIDEWLWSIPDATWNIGFANNHTDIQKKYYDIIINETDYWLKIKSFNIIRALGFYEPLPNYHYIYNVNDNNQHYGMVDSPLRHYLVDSYNSFQDIFAIFRIPWIWFLAGLLGIIWQCRRIEKNHSLGILMLYVISVFYWGAFFVNTPSFEFRYFFPSLYLLIIVISDSFILLISYYLSNKRSMEY